MFDVTRYRKLVLLRRLMALVVAFGLLLGPATASAEAPGPNALPITILAAKTDDALVNASALTGALRKAVRDSRGWSLASGKQALEFLALQLKCNDPIDAVCEARIADVIKVDRFIWAVLAFADKGKTVVGSVNFFERGKGTNKAPIRYSANLNDANDDALIKIANEVVAAITGGPPKGTLRIRTTGVPAQLYIDGVASGALEEDGRSVQLSSGRHAIVARAPGYADAQMVVVIKPASTMEVALKLDEVGASKPTDARMIGGFIGLGLGAAAGAVGLYGSLEVNRTRNNPAFADYRLTVPKGVNTCDDAASKPGEQAANAVVEICNKAKTGEMLQVIGYPLAAVAAGIGGYFLGTSSLFAKDEQGDAADTGWRIEPIVGPHEQRLNVTVRF